MVGFAYDDADPLSNLLNMGECLVFENEEDRAAAMDYDVYGEDYDDYGPASDDEEDRPGSFPPKISDFEAADLTTTPDIFIDKARSDLHKQYKKEWNFIMEMVDSLPDEEGGDEIDKVITLLYGPDSRIYRLFKDAMKLPYDKFCHWLATFFFICRMNRGLTDLCQDEDVNTDRYMHVSIFNKILRKMDSYGKDNHFGKRFWEELEDAYNGTMQAYMPKREHKCPLHLVADDDKVWYNYGPARNVQVYNESYLKRHRHQRDNAKGISATVVCHAATDIPIAMKFDHEDHETLAEVFDEVMQAIFHHKSGKYPKLSGRVTFTLDRGYMRLAILHWILASGGEVMGTVARILGE